MKPPENIEKLIHRINVTPDPRMDRKTLDDIFLAQDNAMKNKLNNTCSNTRSMRMNKVLLKIAVAAIILIAAGIMVYNKTGSFDGATIAWADVVERFHSVNYFSAVFYHKENAQSQPEQIELWVGKGGKARIHINEQIVFCSDGHIQKVFDMETGMETEPKGRAIGLFDCFLRNLTVFSLETLMEFSEGEKLVDVTAVMNEDNLISSELVMFDVKHQDGPQWFRIWALRKSKLPLHVRMLDPHDGGCDDVVFDYSREPKEKFFDPAAFSEAVKTARSPDMIPYLLWEDQTGKTMTPKKTGEVKLFDFQTKTLDGQPWSFAEHQGKTILIKFWYGSDHPLEEFIKAVEERFGQRDDFLMVEIALRHPEKARAYFKNKPKWVILQDSNENVEHVFGSVSEQSVYILDKYGQLRKPEYTSPARFGVAAVDEALNGLVYDSYHTGLISDVRCSTEETAKQWYGAPDSIETRNQDTVWKYRRYNVDKTEYFDVSVIFNQNKRLSNITTSHNIVDPATVKLRISEEWWQKEVAAKLDPGLISKPNAVFTVSFDQGNTNYPLGGDAYRAKPVSFKTETSYSRSMVPGKYDLKIELRETHSPYKLLWSQILIKDCELPKNQEKEINF
jgi:hypothetical protein